MIDYSFATDRLLPLRASRTLGALALLVVGSVHLEQYEVAHFSVIPTIGPLFRANFIVAATTGLILLVPLRASVGSRRLLFDSAAAWAGSAVAVGSFAALLISEHTPLFGFMEDGYREEIVIALAAEAVAVVSLAVFLACAARHRRLLTAPPGRPGGTQGHDRAPRRGPRDATSSHAQTSEAS